MVNKQMKNTLTTICILLFVVCPVTSFAAVSASVDRTMVAVDETLVLTIAKDTGSFLASPDLGPLEQNFDVVNRSQQSSTQIVNGQTSSTSSWKIVIAPKKEGRLEIPSITVGKEKTEPLYVQVVKQVPGQGRTSERLFFLEAETDSDEVPVQGQVLFRLRIYWAADAQVMDPGDPEVQDAVVNRVDNTSYDKLIDGRTYKVYQRTYALFPQKSGVMDIPAMSVQVVRQARRDMFDPFGQFGRSGDQLVLRTKPRQVTVTEKPAAFPADAQWLPANGLTIAEEWSGNPQDLVAGDSITLTLTMRAEGLMAEQVPPVNAEEPEGINIYQGKAELENVPTGNGMLGIRTESIALIPTQPGSFELPEIKIPWWDRKNNTVAYATIPPQKLEVKGAVGGTDKSSPAPGSATEARDTFLAPSVPTSRQQVWSIPLLILCAILAAAWLVTLFLLVKTRREFRLQGSGLEADRQQIGLREKEAFRQLVAACRSNDPKQIREKVISWARMFWPEETIQTYEDIRRQTPGSELGELLEEVDSLLYSNESEPGSWQGENLLEALKEVRSGIKTGEKSPGTLHPLYK